jgi:uncharacterized protein with HEPN domain
MLSANLELLRHIFDEATFILDNMEDRSKDDLLNDGLFSRAMIRSLEIIGEASKKVDEEFKVQYPYIEWRKMAGTRDRLIHNYFGVDYDVVWDVIQNKIPDLHFGIKQIIEQEGT